MTAPRRRPEEAIQSAIVTFLRAVLPHTEACVYANANASKRTASGHASNGVPGLTAGIPDLSIVIRQGRIFYFEVKTKTGVLSEAQKRIEAQFKDLGVPFAVVRSIDDVRAALAQWDIKTREATAP